MKRVIVNCKRVKDSADLYNLFEKKLRAPEYFGRNLDALHDCLTDVFEDVSIVLDDPEALKENLGECFSRLTEVLTVSAQENRHLFFSE